MRRRGARDWFQGEAFDDDPAETVQVHQVGKLDAIAERTARGNDRKFERRKAPMFTESPRRAAAQSLGRILAYA